MRISQICNLSGITLKNIKNKNSDCQNLNDNLKADMFTKTSNIYQNAVSFKGLNAKGKVKQRGILMHITSLPAERSYCGQFLDPQTEQFINWIKEAKQTHWIMNPLNALKADLCPYSSNGRFSRNKFIVNLNKLVEDEYGNILKKSELPDDITAPMFTLEMLEQQKNPRFKIAYERFRDLPETSNIKQEYRQFEKVNNNLWLDQYACYDVISKCFGDNWLKWDKKLQTIPEDAKKENVSIIDKTVELLSPHSTFNIKEGIELFKFEQFLYDKQFNQTVENLNKDGIHLILDLPIGVSATGADTWGQKKVFLLNSNFHADKVSGCPPEETYPRTQMWEHALYDYDSPEFWDYHEKSLKQILKTADLRLDHFVGYVNRAEIPTSYQKPNGEVLYGQNIFKPKNEGGMGEGFFCPEWIVNIYDKKSPDGESVFDMFIRVAKECGKKPEDAYILESLGPLSKTAAYKNFEKKYGQHFISQIVPISTSYADKADLNFSKSTNKKNIALLTGNHDMPSLREYIDNLSGRNFTKEVPEKLVSAFKKFCKRELKLNEEEINNTYEIYRNLMKWFYTKNVKQVQTTLQDALGIYWRPNLPSHWNGEDDRYYQKPTTTGLLPIWCKVFPKDFLTRDNKSGINPGYEKPAKEFVNMINEMYE